VGCIRAVDLFSVGLTVVGLEVLVEDCSSVATEFFIMTETFCSKAAIVDFKLE